ncbi:hypothetical protein CYMTET_11350 [Cymbomonas tetramitiformis]|uniref:Uncharacterized protein n=1 Tax=Cymbomonas tetramitiformis TaxID=36881 RepID=A0AAE0LD36_9CHLO|nr:hypothetical protein CYMTET_11350 [Cymbomonas tetramitiformis]
MNSSSTPRACRVAVRATQLVGSDSKSPPRSISQVPSRVERRGLLLGLTLSGTFCGSANAIEIVRLNDEAVEGLRRRDEAAAQKCTGGMFDCDGDRREYAKKQQENFRAKAEGGKPSECKKEEACADNIFEAVTTGLNGITTAEKMEKMGK